MRWATANSNGWVREQLAHLASNGGNLLSPAQKEALKAYLRGEIESIDEALGVKS